MLQSISAPDSRPTPAGKVLARRLGAVLLLVLAMLVLADGSLPAQALDRPSGPVILTISGAITHTNDGDKAIFDRALLEGLGKTTLRTTTPWTDGVMTFEGVTMKKVLEAVGATGRKLRAVAINDYAIELDAAEFDTIPALLALTMNGEVMRVRDKGPIWLVYPRDDMPALRHGSHSYKWIWQLKSITVR